MLRRRVKITGIGPVTAAGVGRAAFEKGILEPKSRTRKLSNFDGKGGNFIGAAVDDDQFLPYLPASMNLKKVSRHTAFALAAARLALSDANIDIGSLAGKRPLIVTGTLLMDISLIANSILRVREKGIRYGNPIVVTEAPTSSISSHLSSFISTPCTTTTVQTGCCGGLDAVGLGMIMVGSGRANLAICIGTEAPLFFHPMVELNIAGLSPRNANTPEAMGRPFDLWRDSGVIGEGACGIVLEAEESPRPGYAWINGYGQENDTNGASASGLFGSINYALNDAGKHSGAVDLINAWGPGHELVDRVEATTLCRIFGSRVNSIPAVSIKGAIGNPFAAAGAIQVASTALSLRTGWVPPTVNWEAVDPECDLALSAEARELDCRVGLVNSHGINGHNSAVIMEKIP